MLPVQPFGYSPHSWVIDIEPLSSDREQRVPLGHKRVTESIGYKRHSFTCLWRVLRKTVGWPERSRRAHVNRLAPEPPGSDPCPSSNSWALGRTPWQAEVEGPSGPVV